MIEAAVGATLAPVIKSMLTALLTAALVDLAAFRSWKTWDEAQGYNWRTASFRWFQGLIVGLLSGLGLLAV